MRGTSIGLASGTNGAPQTSIEQQEYSSKIKEAEKAAKEHKEYLKKELTKTSPLKIPSTATIKEEKKNGYVQVKYSWQRGEYKYQCRWHTRTPGAPKNQGDSWVVEKRKPGIGHGSDARSAESYVLVGKTKSGTYKWVSKKKWNDAIRARKNGTATKEQKELLKNGHWKA